MNNKLIVILGPTATGKTTLAANLAHSISGEVISADSRQVYRGMDIGTGKDLDDFEVNGVKIPYHLIDIVDAGAEYNVFEYQKDFLKAYETVLKNNNTPILCGGSGLYIDAVVKGYRFLEVPENTKLRTELEQKSIEELNNMLSDYKTIHNTTDSIYKKRIIRAIEVAKFQTENDALIRDFPKIEHLIFGIDFDRAIIKKRITERLKHRLEHEGMIEEVKTLIANGVDPEKLKFYGLEYKLITQHLQDELSYNDMFQKLNSAIHQFAKRQMTWYRKMEKDGFTINWIDGNLPLEEKINFIAKFLD
ncbi:MAG: tRNA (adenosine(37)-N6)-dimethylallyltransferase MiaA [Flavobacteriales bacterium]|nr:tRNA (adenosine(37)-N6)-dimethylallyltransferase MiaA [Flavobacteriales bacterium]